jgi:hypothetical protein
MRLENIPPKKDGSGATSMLLSSLLFLNPLMRFLMDMFEIACVFFLVGVVLATTGALDRDDDDHVGRFALVADVAEDGNEEEVGVDMRDMTGGVEAFDEGVVDGALATGAGESFNTSVLSAIVSNPLTIDCSTFIVPITMNAIMRRCWRRRNESADCRFRPIVLTVATVPFFNF